MNIDGVSADFAPFHLVRTDLPRAQGCGKFYALTVALGFLDYMRKLDPESDYALLHDGGVIDDSIFPRRGVPLPADMDALLAAMPRSPRPEPKPKFRLLKKAA